MKHKLLISTLLVGTALLATAAKDPVLMTINGKDIKLSEFEYLYKKNNQQQVEKESLEQYVERFKTYKLKVADAEASGLDTLPAFVNELNGYRDGIVKNFLEDTTVTERLVNEAYQRSLINVNVDHMMLAVGKDYNDNKKQMALADSLRTVLQNGAVWDSIVAQYSIDPSKSRNNGHYGFVTANSFPYVWEKAAFETPVGEISKPVRTDFGIHFMRVNEVRPSEGEVHARHILILFPKKHSGPTSDTDKVLVKAKIDSIYGLVKEGQDFEELAKKYSQDPGSAKRGGDLGFFGRGRMVPQFENAAFSLKDGEVSEPFETTYGWHIVQRIESKGPASLEEQRPAILAAISRDERSTMARQAIVEKAKVLYNYKVNPDLEKYIVQQIKNNGGYDSTFVDKLRSSDFTAYTYANEKVPVKKIVGNLNPKGNLNDDSAKGYVMSLVEPSANREVMNYYANNLINDNADYRNLLNEYRDGMLLFEISNRKVWEGAGKDTVGLNNYFETNRGKYKWDAPHFKGIILSAKTDSVMDAVKADIAALGESDTLTTFLHKKYNKNIKMERMVVAKGENKAADYLFFGASEIGGTHPYAMVLEGGLINNPEEVGDVRGQVTSDYQDVLEKQWVEELKAKYPVTVNNKVLKKVKE